MTTTAPAGRDLTIDLTRVCCVLLVVFVHLVLVGVGRDATGGLVLASPVDGARWVAPVSWAAEIMPLFFVVGGFAAKAGWDSATARGQGAGRFVVTRLERLARPALPVYAVLTVALGAALLLGVPAELVDAVAVPVGSILWFLGAYAAVQALAPFMLRLHARAPWLTLAVLLAATLLVDVVRLYVGIKALGLPPIDQSGYGVGEQLFGLPNTVLVWLFAQQLGFSLRDGVFARLAWFQLVAVMVLGVAALLLLVGLGSYSWSMLTNQWPPTTPLAALAVIQAAGYTLLRPVLAAAVRTSPVQGLLVFFGPRLMSIYLWHVTAIVLLTAVMIFGPWPAPVPGSAAWWLSRPVLLVAVLGIVWIISLATARLERPRARDSHDAPGTGRRVAAVLCFVLPCTAISLYGLDVLLGALAVAGTLAALWLTAPRRWSEPGEARTGGPGGRSLARMGPA